MATPTLEDLAGRLRLLEATCRDLRHRARRRGILAAAAGQGALALALVGARRDDGTSPVRTDRLSAGDLEARRLVLKDEDGRPWFTLERRDGVTQMLMEGVDEVGPRHGRADGGGRVGQGVKEDRGAEKAARARLVFVVNRGGVPYISIKGNQGGVTLLGVNPEGEPYVSVSGKDGTVTLGGRGEAGTPGLMMWDEQGRGRIRLGLRPDGTVAVEVLEGKEAARQPGNTGTSPQGSDGPKPGGPTEPKPTEPKR